MSKKQLFGIHSITPYSLATGKPISSAPFSVVGSFSVASSQEIISNKGGSSYYDWGQEVGGITIEGSMLLREYPSALLEIATGIRPTEISAESSGSVNTIINVSGVSTVASTGISSVGLKSGSSVNVPFALYTVEVVSATTIDIYVSSDVDFAQGINKSFKAGTQKINTSPLTITSSTAVEIPDFGIELMGGSGSIAMTVGDTATFSSKPVNKGSRSLLVGDPLARVQSIGILAQAQRQSNGAMVSLNIFSALIAGLPLTLTEKAFSESEITFGAKRAVNTFDPTQEGIYSLTEVTSSNI